MDILVTGGAGFIGYNISKIIAKDSKNKVCIIDNLSKGKKDEEFLELINKPNVEFLDVDLADLDIYQEIPQKFNQIYHLAAVVGVKKVSENPTLTLKNNLLSTLYLLEHIKSTLNRTKILFTSSCEVYAGTINRFNTPIPTPEDIPLCIEDVYNPRWTYAATKLIGETMCLHYSQQFNFDTTIVRYHNVYGPRMGINHVIPEFIIRLKNDPTKLEMFGGDQYRAFCYVTDAAKMTINLMNNEKANFKIVNVGNNKDNIKISSIGEQLSEIMKISPKFVEKGAPIGSPNQRIPDLTLIKKLGDFIDEVTFEEGLVKVYDWYEKHWKTLRY